MVVYGDIVGDYWIDFEQKRGTAVKDLLVYYQCYYI